MIGSCSFIEWEYKYKRFRGAFQGSNEAPSLIKRTTYHSIYTENNPIIFLDAASKDLVVDDNHQ